jgi:hypothetical protein
MEEAAPRRNNLPLLFLHLGVAPTGGVGGQVVWSSRRFLDLERLVSGGWCSALLWVTVALTAAVMLAVACEDDGRRRWSSSSTESGEDGGAVVTKGELVVVLLVSFLVQSCLK